MSSGIQNRMAAKYPKKEFLETLTPTTPSTTTATTTTTTTAAPDPNSVYWRRILLISLIGAAVYILLSLPQTIAITGDFFKTTGFNTNLVLIHGVVFFLLSVVLLKFFKVSITPV